MTRVISGVLLAAAALAAILFLPFIALRVLVCLVAGLAADEYVRIASAVGGSDKTRPTVSRSSRWIVIASVIYACWWAAVPAPLSVAPARFNNEATATVALTLIVPELSRVVPVPAKLVPAFQSCVEVTNRSVAATL